MKKQSIQTEMEDLNSTVVEFYNPFTLTRYSDRMRKTGIWISYLKDNLRNISKEEEE